MRQKRGYSLPQAPPSLAWRVQERFGLAIALPRRFRLLVDTVDPLGRHTRLAYDNRYRLTQLAMPDGTLFEYAYNLTNHPQFEAPQINLTAPSFGRITNTLNNGRVLQLGLRLVL